MMFVPGQYDAPPNLPAGCHALLKILKDATGIEHRPIYSWQAANFDFSSYDTWEGTVPNDNSKDQWLQGKESSIAKGTRNVSSIWIDNEDVKCNGLTIKWCDGCFMSGHSLPIVGLFDGFSEKELPQDRFIVLDVYGMNVNDHLDAKMNDKPGYFVPK
jgi:hypothetical protein